MSIIEKDDKATNDSINADACTTMQEAYSSINFTRYSIRIGLSTLLWAHAKRVFMKYYWSTISLRVWPSRQFWIEQGAPSVGVDAAALPSAPPPSPAPKNALEHDGVSTCSRSARVTTSRKLRPQLGRCAETQLALLTTWLRRPSPPAASFEKTSSQVSEHDPARHNYAKNLPMCMTAHPNAADILAVGAAPIPCANDSV